VIRLQPCRKGYSKETQRAVPPEETLRRARARLPAAGITRVAGYHEPRPGRDPGLLEHQADRSDRAISVYNGKGATSHRG